MDVGVLARFVEFAGSALLDGNEADEAVVGLSTMSDSWAAGLVPQAVTTIARRPASTGHVRKGTPSLISWMKPLGYTRFGILSLRDGENRLSICVVV